MLSCQHSPVLFGSRFIPQPPLPFELSYPDDGNFPALSDPFNIDHPWFDLGSGFVGQAETSVSNEMERVGQVFGARPEQNLSRTLQWLDPVVFPPSQATDNWSRLNTPCAEHETSTPDADRVGISNWSMNTVRDTRGKMLQGDSVPWMATVPLYAARSGMRGLASDSNPSPFPNHPGSAADSPKPKVRQCSQKHSQIQSTLRRTQSESQDECYSRLQPREMAKAGSRREQHSLVEARYREKINRKLAELRALLPEWSDEERISCKDPLNSDRRIICSKVQILEKAIDRILSFQTENANLSRRVAIYERTVEQLRQHIEEDNAKKTE